MRYRLHFLRFQNQQAVHIMKCSRWHTERFYFDENFASVPSQGSPSRG